MLDRFIKYIDEEHLYAQGQQVLLAVSGGRDSVALTDLAQRAGMSYAIAHCNFHLRPGDCDSDEQFVRQLAAQRGVRCFVAQFDTIGYAKQNDLSVEEAARNLRYSFFEEVRSREGYDLVATAHHRDDSIETFFINLLRGTGIAGLHGIQSRNGDVIRPLLCFGRDDINQYIRERDLPFVEDTTNSQPLYLRNRIRLRLLPLLRELSPSFDTTMQANMRRLADIEQVYVSAVSSSVRKLLQPVEGGYSISINELRQYYPLPTYFFEILHPFGFTVSQTQEAMALLHAQSGKQLFSPTYRLLRNRDELLLTKRLDIRSELYQILSVSDFDKLPFSLTYEVVPCEGNSPITLKPSQAWFDMDKLHFPLQVSRWRKGDRIIPFGMRGSRLVSDLFSDLKLSLWDKEQVWILRDAGGAILWVIGYRTSELAKVETDTRTILKLQL